MRTGRTETTGPDLPAPKGDTGVFELGLNMRPATDRAFFPWIWAYRATRACARAFPAICSWNTSSEFRKTWTGGTCPLARTHRDVPGAAAKKGRFRTRS